MGYGCTEMTYCRMTMESEVVEVTYNDNLLEVAGILIDWTDVKEFNFYPEINAELKIKGFGNETCHGCDCSGMLLECTNGIISSMDWSAHGNWNDIGWPQWEDE